MAPPSRKAARSAEFVSAGNDAVVKTAADFKGLTGEAFADLPWWKRLHPVHVPLLTITPALAVFGLLTADWVWQTYAFAVFYYFFTGFGITAGESQPLFQRPVRPQSRRLLAFPNQQLDKCCDQTRSH